VRSRAGTAEQANAHPRSQATHGIFLEGDAITENLSFNDNGRERVGPEKSGRADAVFGGAPKMLSRRVGALTDSVQVFPFHELRSLPFIERLASFGMNGRFSVSLDFQKSPLAHPSASD